MKFYSPSAQVCPSPNWVALLMSIFVCLVAVRARAQGQGLRIGREVAIPRHVQDGEEYQLTVPQLIAFGEKLFTAKWTIQEGAERPQSKGTGAPLSEPSDPRIFPRNFNRISDPDSNSCSGCHNEPFVGDGGDHITSVFVLGQRFDFATFDHSDPGSPVALWTSAASSPHFRTSPTSARPSA